MREIEEGEGGEDYNTASCAARVILVLWGGTHRILLRIKTRYNKILSVNVKNCQALQKRHFEPTILFVAMSYSHRPRVPVLSYAGKNGGIYTMWERFVDIT